MAERAHSGEMRGPSTRPLVLLLIRSPLQLGASVDIRVGRAIQPRIIHFGRAIRIGEVSLGFAGRGNVVGTGTGKDLLGLFRPVAAVTMH